MRKLGNIEPFITQLAKMLREIEQQFPQKFNEKHVESINLNLDVDFLKQFHFIDEKAKEISNEELEDKCQPMYVYVIKLAQLSFFNIIEK